MFQSYQYIKYLGYDETTNKHSHQYKIIDSDWEEVEVEVEVVVGVGVAVVKAYHKHGYCDKQIAKQLFLCFRYIAERDNYSLDQMVSWSKQYSPEIWIKYGQDIKMFLLFS